jgi:hypothetical protein
MRVFVSLLVALSDAMKYSLNDRKALCVHYVSHLEHTPNVRDGLARKIGSKTIRNRLLRSQLHASKQHAETLGKKLFDTESSRQTAARQPGDAQGKLQAANKDVETLQGRLSTAVSTCKSSDTDLTSMKSQFDASNKQVLSLQQELSTAHDKIGSLQRVSDGSTTEYGTLQNTYNQLDTAFNHEREQVWELTAVNSGLRAQLDRSTNNTEAADEIARLHKRVAAIGVCYYNLLRAVFLAFYPEQGSTITEQLLGDQSWYRYASLERITGANEGDIRDIVGCIKANTSAKDIAYSGLQKPQAVLETRIKSDKALAAVGCSLDSLKQEVREIIEYANTVLRLAIKEVVEKHSLICSAEVKHVQELETLVGVYRDQISGLRAFITKHNRPQVDHEELQTIIRTQYLSQSPDHTAAVRGR